MGTIKKFEELEVWKIARGLSQEVFQATLKEDFSRDFGLKSVDLSRKISNLINYLKTSEIKGNKYKASSPEKNKLL